LYLNDQFGKIFDVRRVLRPVPGEEGTVIGYLRVSTSEQADSGLGLGAQKTAIEVEAGRRGWTVTRWYEEAGASAKSMAGRPALAAALTDLSSGRASVLIVAKLDRLARSVADYASLVRQAEREGWALLIGDLAVDMTTPAGGLVANITASVAEWERRVIAERTREALKVKRDQGAKLGRPRLLASAIEDRIKVERARGSTLQAIADGLNSEEVATPTGRRWSPALVRKVVVRPA
jgi:DNA invertase Pin-like site-specific DNA recombinase